MFFPRQRMKVNQMSSQITFTFRQNPQDHRSDTYMRQYSDTIALLILLT